MKKSTLTVSIVHDGTLDIRAACLDLQEKSSQMAGVGIAHACCKKTQPLSEQGYKVFRARVCGVTVEMAGDAAHSEQNQEIINQTFAEVQCQGSRGRTFRAMEAVLPLQAPLFKKVTNESYFFNAVDSEPLRVYNSTKASKRVNRQGY